MKIFAAVLLYFFRFEMWERNFTVGYRPMLTLKMDGPLYVRASPRRSTRNQRACYYKKSSLQNVWMFPCPVVMTTDNMTSGSTNINSSRVAVWFCLLPQPSIGRLVGQECTLAKSSTVFYTAFFPLVSLHVQCTSYSSLKFEYEHVYISIHIQLL